MKTLKIKIAISFLICVLSYSCAIPEDEPKKETPYYSFQPEDKPFLLDNYNNPSKQLIFKNEDNEVLSFIFISFEESKEGYNPALGGFGPPTTGGVVYYYDTRRIKFKFEQYSDPTSYLEFRFNKFSGTLKGGIRFPLWNIDRFYLSSAPINFNANPFKMTINGVVYNDVIKIVSSNSSIEYMIGPFSRNVHVLYYDLYFGLIGFDDLNGEEWRLQQ